MIWKYKIIILKNLKFCKLIGMKLFWWDMESYLEAFKINLRKKKKTKTKNLTVPYKLFILF